MTGSGADAVVDVAFFGVMLPAMAIDVIGSTMLGIDVTDQRERRAGGHD